MLKIPKPAANRVNSKLKHYQSIAASHKTRDVSEADTVTLIKDIFADVFGYDKYEELTSEQQIRGTYCDLAVKINGKIKYLIEVKAAGVALNESHLRQALGYGVNQGIEWVVLTNAVDWRLYKIKFTQPVEHEEISSFNLLDVNPKNEEDLRRIFLLCKEGIGADAMATFHQHTQVMNKYTVAQILQSEPIVAAVRKEMRKLFPEIKVDAAQLLGMLQADVLKREVMEGDRAKETQQRLRRAATRNARTAKKVGTKDTGSDDTAG